MKRHPEERKVFKRLFSILLILVMVLSFSSCESGLSAQIVNGAIESLDKITTYQYDMNVNSDFVYDTFEVVVSTEFNGVVDVENEQMEMDINMSSIINGDEGQRVGEMYLIDNIVYENVTLIVNDVHDMGPMWTKREMPTEYWGAMNQVKAQIELLEEAVQVEVIGSDEVRGIDCYVLEIIPDMEKFWQISMQQPEVAMLPAIDEEFLQEVFKGFSMKQWIEKDTYFLAKAEIEMALELTPEALGSPEEQGLITMDITIDLMVYNYNQPVSIILPQEAEEALEMPTEYTTTTIIVTEPATTPTSSLPTSTPTLPPSHTGSPIISMNIAHLMQGQFSHLAIYEDGYVIRNEERGLRPVAEHPPTRSWYTGQLTEEELTGIIDFFESSRFMELNDHYVFAGKPIDNGGMACGDNFVTIIISYGDLQKTVVASAYLTYADMPSPLNEIYDRLWGVALETSFVTSEIISN